MFRIEKKPVLPVTTRNSQLSTLNITDL